ncbi:MAG: hypothetical protein AAF289_00245 [Cyanobacteria bacterium P01_A01_bin.135]
MRSAQTVVVPLAIWSLLAGFLIAIAAAAVDGIQRLRRLHQIPCSRCRYRTCSPYLKCAVHPMSAFSETAISCRDYELEQRSLKPASSPIWYPWAQHSDRKLRLDCNTSSIRSTGWQWL